MWPLRVWASKEDSYFVASLTHQQRDVHPPSGGFAIIQRLAIWVRRGRWCTTKGCVGLDPIGRESSRAPRDLSLIAGLFLGGLLGPFWWWCRKVLHAVGQWARVSCLLRRPTTKTPTLAAQHTAPYGCLAVARFRPCFKLVLAPMSCLGMFRSLKLPSKVFCILQSNGIRVGPPHRYSNQRPCEFNFKISYAKHFGDDTAT